jgi:class 3 adenylate cyclase
LEGDDHLWWVGDAQSIVNEIREFLTGELPEAEPDRVLATILFTDIVDSTTHALHMGDRGWCDLMEVHNLVAQREINRFRGRLIKNTGDGFLSTFDGPARAIRCALAVSHEVKRLGIRMRAGVHTGEVELIGKDVRGIAVHIAARVLEKAIPNEVWVSATVKDLAVGSGFSYGDRGLCDLKGLPEQWRLFAVSA